MYSDLKLKANVLLQSGIFQDNACFITLLQILVHYCVHQSNAEVCNGVPTTLYRWSAGKSRNLPSEIIRLF